MSEREVQPAAVAVTNSWTRFVCSHISVILDSSELDDGNNNTQLGAASNFSRCCLAKWTAGETHAERGAQWSTRRSAGNPTPFIM